MNWIAKSAALILIYGGALAQAPEPKNGYVPDEKTAVKIAEAVLTPIYGKDNMRKAEPFQAISRNGVWTVFSTPKSPFTKGGGTPEIKINQRTAAILGYYYSR